jgi:molecular chaperone GrpE
MNNHDRPHRRVDGDGEAKHSITADLPADGEASVATSALAVENAALRDQLLRALADVENTRRQAERSKADSRKYSIAEFAREMLGVSDTLQRAIGAAESQDRPADAPLLEGVRATERMLAGVFERFGLRKIAPLGEPFDPNSHEAMMEVDDASRAPGTVATVLEDGYAIHDRLLRPARVAVVRRRPGPSTESARVPDADEVSAR